MAADLQQEDFERLAQEMSYCSRPGDLVRVNAPEPTPAHQYHGEEGTIEEYRHGWVIVRLDVHGSVRFRADELLIL